MYRRFWIYAFLFFLTTIHFIDRIALSVASSQIAKELGLTPVQMGYLFSPFIWLYVIALILVGMTSDKVGAKSVSRWSIALCYVATALIGFSAGFVTLIATRLMMGARIQSYKGLLPTNIAFGERPASSSTSPNRQAAQFYAQ